jgi:hypothetical protein
MLSIIFLSHSERTQLRIQRHCCINHPSDDLCKKMLISFFQRALPSSASSWIRRMALSRSYRVGIGFPLCNFALDLLRTSGFVAFWDYFGQFSIPLAGAISTKSILSPQAELKIGQNNPKKQRTLRCARGLISRLDIEFA